MTFLVMTSAPMIFVCDTCQSDQGELSYYITSGGVFLSEWWQVCLNGMEILSVRVSLVSRDFVNVKCLGCPSNQSRKLQGVSRLIWGSLNTSNDMSFDSAHDVSLNPILMAALFPPLVVEPSGISAGGEARGINSEVSINSFQRTCALLNESLEQWL